jgi:hypothetical protein
MDDASRPLVQEPVRNEPLDTRLEELRRNIVHSVVFEPEDRRELLLEPHTRIVRSNGEDYKCFTLWKDRIAVIRIGGGTWPVLNTFTRAAATYFVPDGAGVRPSGGWPAARDALASTIDWFAVGPKDHVSLRLSSRRARNAPRTRSLRTPSAS